MSVGVEGVVLVIPGENKDNLTNAFTCISNTPSPIPNIQSASLGNEVYECFYALFLNE